MAAHSYNGVKPRQQKLHMVRQHINKIISGTAILLLDIAVTLYIWALEVLFGVWSIGV